MTGTTPIIPHYSPFENLKISTITGIVQINNHINLEGAYCWLQMPTYAWQHGANHRIKSDIPWPGVTGSISSIRGGELTRGYQRASRPMKNSITLYLATLEKNVSIKVGPQKLHITGGKSRKEIILATQLLLRQLVQAEDNFRHCQRNPQQWAKAISWFLQAIKGPTITRVKSVPTNSNTHGQRGEETSPILEGPADELHTEINHIDIATLQESLDELHIEENGGDPDQIARPITMNMQDSQVVPILVAPSAELQLDQRMVEILSPLAREFQYFSDIYRHLELMNMCVEVVSSNVTPTNPLLYTDLQLGMTNYNYHIGFNVDRLSLASYMEEQGFIPDYNNATDVGMKFLLPFQTEDTVIVHRKKKTKHTFILYRSGQITQSSPNPELAEIAYNKFMKVVSSAYPYVQMHTHD